MNDVVATYYSFRNVFYWLRHREELVPDYNASRCDTRRSEPVSLLGDELLHSLRLTGRRQYDANHVLRIRRSVVVAKLPERVVYPELEALVAQVHVHLGHVAVEHDHLDLFRLVWMLEEVRAVVVQEADGTREAALELSDRHADRGRLQRQRVRSCRFRCCCCPILELVRGLELRSDVLRALRDGFELIRERGPLERPYGSCR